MPAAAQFQPAADRFATQNYSNPAYRQPVFQSPPQSGYQPPGNNYAYNDYRPEYQYEQPPGSVKTGLATASMVLGILAFISTIFFVGVLIAPVGLVLSIVALVKAGKKPHEYGGKGLAISGLVTNSIVFLLIPVILAVVIPNLAAARAAANESSALSSLRSIANANVPLPLPDGKQTECLSLEELARDKRIDEALADGEHHGYLFEISPHPGGGCFITATPMARSQGIRSFYYSTFKGKIQGGDHQGQPASYADPYLEP